MPGRKKAAHEDTRLSLEGLDIEDVLRRAMDAGTYPEDAPKPVTIPSLDKRHEGAR